MKKRQEEAKRAGFPTLTDIKSEKARKSNEKARKSTKKLLQFKHVNELVTNDDEINFSKKKTLRKDF